MALFSAFDRRLNDNSVRVTNISDSYNMTSSWSQGVSDVGNTVVELNKPGGVLEQLVPVMIVGLVIVGLIGLGGRR
jgi:hypothetical protein